MEFFLGFMAGMIVAVWVTIGYGIYKLKQVTKARNKIIEDLQKSATEVEKGLKHVTDRLSQARAITEKQLALLVQIDQPSKNALHSKWKNDLNHEVRKLEGEKNDILKSILKDGYNPSITILNGEDQKETIKLSDYFVRIGVDVGNNTLATGPAKDPTEPKKVGKFTVYNGGNNSKVDN